MNIFIQIGIGLFPGSIVAFTFLLRRKAFHIHNILAVLLFSAACSGSIFVGIKLWIENGIPVKNLSRKSMITFANALFTEGAYDEALEVLQEYSAYYGYDSECRKLSARINLAEEDYISADGLYRHLDDPRSILPEEIMFVSDKRSHNPADLALMDYLADYGEDIGEYGFSQVKYEKIQEVMQVKPDNILRSICREIENEYKIDKGSMRSCAAAVASINTNNSKRSEGEDTLSSSRYRRAFEAIEKENPELLNLECVEKARLKAYILSGDYDKIAENLDDTSSYHYLIVTSELYMGGFIKSTDFSDDYQKMDIGGILAVKNQLNKLYQDNRDNFSVQEGKRLKGRVNAVITQISDPAFLKIKDQLRTVAEGEADTDRTKIYLELAKIENYVGNESSAESYLGQAIYDSQSCRDDSYVSAMGQIINVINNDNSDNMENIKNVPEYVETIMEHSTTLDMESSILVKGQAGYDSGSMESEGREKNGKSFGQMAVDYVSRIKSAVSIGMIDTSSFEHITAKVQISNDYVNDTDVLEKEIRVYDCGAEISDFSLKKVDYTASNILLCCDISGSMGNSIQGLRDAVVTFITDKNPKENIAVVTFNQSILERKGFGTSDNELMSFAENMSVYGGTDMFSAVVNCLDNFSAKPGENNILILMTDGQDNYPRDRDTIYEQIGGLAALKDVTVYTMGLGRDVDTVYLNTIAESGNGDFVYVSDSASLTSFYDMLHGQVYNQYELSYNALNTTNLSERTLEVKLTAENLSDIKTYSLKDNSEEEQKDGLDVLQGISIYGMSPGYIYKGLQDVDVKLKGTGFSENNSVTVKLDGNIDYMIDAEFEDTENYKVTIPKSIAVGTYNVDITINGERVRLPNGFTVHVQGDEKKTEFGPYIFTSSEKIENPNGGYILHGAVEMNGWLHFKGDVVIDGNLEDSVIHVSEDSGSYVEFDPATAEGIGSFFAQHGISLDIPALYDFNLYNDQEHLFDYGSYKADDISTGILKISQLLFFDSPTVRIYPNSIGLYFMHGNTVLPWQDRLFALAGKAEEKMFSFDLDGSAKITDKNIGIKLDVSYKDPDKDEFEHRGNFLNAPVYYNGSIKVKIDTIKDEYMIGALVRFAFFAKQSGLGLEISWKEMMQLDSVKLKLELKKPLLVPTAIPMVVNDFTFKASELQYASMANWKFSGSVSLSVGELKAYFPALEKFFKDFSFFEIPDMTASLRLSPFQAEGSAKIKFVKEITLADTEIRIGNFEYTNEMLDLNFAEVKGVYSKKLERGFIWNSVDGRFKVELTGTGEFDAHSRFIGVCYTGTGMADINWWLLNLEGSRAGKWVMGLYVTDSGKKQWVLAYRYQESLSGKYKGCFYYIDEDGNCGKNHGYLNKMGSGMGGR